MSDQITNTAQASAPAYAAGNDLNAALAMGNGDAIRNAGNGADLYTTRGGAVYNASKGGTLTVTDSGAIAAMSDISKLALVNASQQTSNLFQTVEDALAKNAAAAKQANDAAASLLSASLASQSDLAKNAATGGQSETNKMILWVLGIAAALIGAFMYFRK